MPCPDLVPDLHVRGGATRTPTYAPDTPAAPSRNQTAVPMTMELCGTAVGRAVSQVRVGEEGAKHEYVPDRLPPERPRHTSD